MEGQENQEKPHLSAEFIFLPSFRRAGLPRHSRCGDGGSHRVAVSRSEFKIVMSLLCLFAAIPLVLILPAKGARQARRAVAPGEGGSSSVKVGQTDAGKG
jgi:hypothetical protein